MRRALLPVFLLVLFAIPAMRRAPPPPRILRTPFEVAPRPEVCPAPCSPSAPALPEAVEKPSRRAPESTLLGRIHAYDKDRPNDWGEVSESPGSHALCQAIDSALRGVLPDGFASCDIAVVDEAASMYAVLLYLVPSVEERHDEPSQRIVVVRHSASWHAVADSASFNAAENSRAWQSHLVLQDLDGDGRREVGVAGHSGCYCQTAALFALDGQVLSRIPCSEKDSLFIGVTMRAEDVSGDGVQEMIEEDWHAPEVMPVRKWMWRLENGTYRRWRKEVIDWRETDQRGEVATREEPWMPGDR